MRSNTFFVALAVLLIPVGSGRAQTPAHDPSARLQEVLPADVAERVLARIAAARARELPAQALENRALKFAARGVAPAEIERAIGQFADRMETARGLIVTARGTRATPDELESAADALRQGVDGAAVSALAKTAPSGRSLAVPLFVIGSLVERGLPSDEALARVFERLQQRATDNELEGMAVARGRSADAPRGDAARPATAPAGPATAPRGPGTVPQNAGKPSTAPVVPPGRRP